MLTRRTFLERLGGAAATLLLADHTAAGSILSTVGGLGAGKPLRIRGCVSSGGMGIARVGVSDGRSVVMTDGEGMFELASDSSRRFVHVSLPAGYEIPTQPTGTARLYRPIRPDSGGVMETGFTLEPMKGQDLEHAFILMADPQTRTKGDVERLHGEAVPDLRETAARLSPAHVFGVACGDIMYGNLELFPGYERAVREMGFPCFQVLGNHDVDSAALIDRLSTRTFERYFGPAYYSFNRGEIHYVVLDDICWTGDYIGFIDDDQLGWLGADLALVEKGRTVVVFMHIPPYTSRHTRYGRTRPGDKAVVANREQLYRLLEPFRAYAVCGHMHESEYLRDGGADIHVCGALCGAWWTGPICQDGTPNGYAVYTVKGGELQWRYKATGKDAGHGMRLYPPGSDSARTRHFIANVWSADDAWKVVWYEDGERRGGMKRGIGWDPLAERLYLGKKLPERYAWVDPVLTGHLFYAIPSPGTRRIVVEATDRWGNIYTGRLGLA